MKQLVPLLFLLKGAHMLLFSKPSNSVCYPDVGCFSTDPPFSVSDRILSVLPQSPDIIKTTFILYTRESSLVPQNLDARFPGLSRAVWTNFKARPTKFIVHGFVHTVRTWPWMEDLAKELLKYGDYNVIVVDWSGGNQFPYTQATANTRLVGAQIGLLINYLIENGTLIADNSHILGDSLISQENGTLTADNFHIIGHSLGAHIAGYAGERVTGLGRITGLDPAGPYFRDVDIRVRLDDTDAVFVDVIHTDDLILGFGTSTLSGHADFFPNGGHNQPGCGQGLFSEISNSGLVRGTIDTLFCSHQRAVTYFHDSINSPCPFLAFPCSSEDSFKNKQCETCGGVGCSRMGFHADKYKPPAGQKATYYLRTGDEEPFCRYHYTVTVKLSSGPWKSVSGEASVAISGNLFKSSWVSLTGGKTTTFTPGQSLTFYVDLPQDAGNVTAVSFKFEQSFSLSTLFGQTSTVDVEEIDIYAIETDARFKFCAAGNIQFDSYVTLISTCSHVPLL